MHEELDAQIIKMITDKIAWVSVGLSQECSDKLFSVRISVDDGIPVQKDRTVGGEVILVLGERRKLHLVEDGGPENDG